MLKHCMAFLLFLPGFFAVSGVSASAEESALEGSAPCMPGPGARHMRGFGGASDCMADLPADKQKLAVQIMEDAMPGLRDLDHKIAAKRSELEHLNFNDGSDPEQLSRLGRELQALRDSMKLKLREVSDRLRTETGMDLRVPDTRGCSSMRKVYMYDRAQGRK